MEEKPKQETTKDIMLPINLYKDQLYLVNINNINDLLEIFRRASKLNVKYQEITISNCCINHFFIKLLEEFLESNPTISKLNFEEYNIIEKNEFNHRKYFFKFIKNNENITSYSFEFLNFKAWQYIHLLEALEGKDLIALDIELFEHSQYQDKSITNKRKKLFKHCMNIIKSSNNLDFFNVGPHNIEENKEIFQFLIENNRYIFIPNLTGIGKNLYQLINRTFNFDYNQHLKALFYLKANINKFIEGSNYKENFNLVSLIHKNIALLNDFYYGKCNTSFIFNSALAVSASEMAEKTHRANLLIAYTEFNELSKNDLLKNKHTIPEILANFTYLDNYKNFDKLAFYKNLMTSNPANKVFSRLTEIIIHDNLHSNLATRIFLSNNNNISRIQSNKAMETHNLLGIYINEKNYIKVSGKNDKNLASNLIHETMHKLLFAIFQNYGRPFADNEKSPSEAKFFMECLNITIQKIAKKLEENVAEYEDINEKNAKELGNKLTKKLEKASLTEEEQAIFFSIISIFTDGYATHDFFGEIICRVCALNFEIDNKKILENYCGWWLLFIEMVISCKDLQEKKEINELISYPNQLVSTPFTSRREKVVALIH